MKNNWKSIGFHWVGSPYNPLSIPLQSPYNPPTIPLQYFLAEAVQVLGGRPDMLVVVAYLCFSSALAVLSEAHRGRAQGSQLLWS